MKIAQRGCLGRGALIILAVTTLAGCGGGRGIDLNPFNGGGHDLSGQASWYGPGFHGNRTASGERFDQRAMTAAHKTLPFGTMVKVTNLKNGRSVVVRINDRGPFIRGRIIDLSEGAAERVGMIVDGVVPVRVEVL